MSDIKIGSIVVCPVTDNEGENHHRMGELVKINSRFATVEARDGEIFHVGKTKIELVSEPKPKKAEFFCPGCNKSHHSCFSNDDQIADGKPSFESHEYWCQDCDMEFGPKIKLHGLARAADYDYQPCVAASGKKSKDNNDAVAQELRGQTLDFAYKRAAEYLEVSEDSLRARYRHLNPGQQRMCLGNRIRGAK